MEAQRAAGLREPKMHVAYVLRLGADENGAHKYYVGSSCNFMSRLHNHIMGNDRSAAWVRRWRYEELVETRHCHDRLSALTTEVGLTVQYNDLKAGGNSDGKYNNATNYTYNIKAVLGLPDKVSSDDRDFSAVKGCARQAQKRTLL